MAAAALRAAGGAAEAGAGVAVAGADAASGAQHPLPQALNSGFKRTASDTQVT